MFRIHGRFGDRSDLGLHKESPVPDPEEIRAEASRIIACDSWDAMK